MSEQNPYVFLETIVKAEAQRNVVLKNDMKRENILMDINMQMWRLLGKNGH